jgi:hypothetical protein
MKMNILKFGLLLSVLGLTACGGGGGSSGPTGPVTSTLSFPLNLAQKSLVSSGVNKTFTVSGTCGGTGNYTVASATTPSIFEGVTGFSAVQSVTASLTNCSVASLAETTTAYYDANYNQLGYDSGVGGDYAVNLALPAIPASVMVGNTGTVGTATTYTDSTKAFANGVDNISYVIEADTASTAIVNIVTKNYDTLGVLGDTVQERFRIAATGALVPVSVDIQASNGSTTHLLFKFN